LNNENSLRRKYGFFVYEIDREEKIGIKIYFYTFAKSKNRIK